MYQKEKGISFTRLESFSTLGNHQWISMKSSILALKHKGLKQPTVQNSRSIQNLHTSAAL